MPRVSETWIFGYGSLLWKQDFPFDEAKPAFVHG
jgi:cation transport protein ChaC